METWSIWSLMETRTFPFRTNRNPLIPTDTAPNRKGFHYCVNRPQVRILIDSPLWLTFRKTWRMNGQRAFSLFCSKNYWKYTLRRNLDGCYSLARTIHPGSGWNSSWQQLTWNWPQGSVFRSSFARVNKLDYTKLVLLCVRLGYLHWMAGKRSRKEEKHRQKSWFSNLPFGWNLLVTLQKKKNLNSI